MTISYTFNGKLDTSYIAWEQWINDALIICKTLGVNANYYEIGVVNKASSKTCPISGMKRKMTNIKKKNDFIDGITIMVLPENYSSASFDYTIVLSRNASRTSYVTLIVNQNNDIYVDEKIIVDMLRKNILADSGEVYEMDIHDCPELYAAKSKSSIKSLKIVSILK